MSLPGVPTTISRPLSIASAAEVNITKNKLVILSYNYCPSKQDKHFNDKSHPYSCSLNCNQSIKVNEEFGHHLRFLQLRKAKESLYCRWRATLTL